MTATAEKDLERRKQLRLHLRPDLEMEAQKYEGRSHLTVKDPIALRYYYFTEREEFLLRRLDGRHTLEDIQKAFEQRFRPERLGLEEVEGFGQQLLKAGLAIQDSPQAGNKLFENRQKTKRRELLAALTNILYIKIPVSDPDRLLTRLLPFVRWMFSAWFAAVSIAVMLAALLLVATHFQTFLDRLPTSQAFFRFQTAAYLWLALGIVKIVHEFGHGLSCKAFRREVHEMGVLLLCLSPALYCNVSDAWMLANKWKRILISFAGIYVELMIASLATFVWWNSHSQPFLNNLSLSLMIVCSVNTVIFNGNPLMRFDGYYVLFDWLEIPNLRERANEYLKNIVQAHALGIDLPPEPPMALGRRILFVTYAVVSYVYRWVLTFVVLWFMHKFLKPYKLEAVGTILACISAGSMVGWPLYSLGRNLRKRGRLPEMAPKRVCLSAALLASFLLAALLVPLPLSRIRQTGLVQPQPEAYEKVFVPVPGILERLHVRDGQAVAKNDILAEFTSLDLETHLAEARNHFETRTAQLQALQEELGKVTDPQEKGKIEVSIATAVGERARYAREADVYSKGYRRLVLRAPRAGVVLGTPHKDEVGKLWDKEQDTPFCCIGAPGRLRALVPLTPADYRLLKDELQATRGQGEDLPVTIRVQGREGETWRGKIGPLPEAEAKEVPLALTSQAGGPLAVKPGLRPKTYAPQSQQYLVAVDFLESDRAICPGTLAQVKVHCRWRSGGWWLWRTLSGTFDLGLI